MENYLNAGGDGMAVQNPDFYHELRAKFKTWIDSDEGKNHKWAEYLLATPDLFHLLCKLSIDKDVPIVDTNVARILYRLFDLPGKEPANPARNKGLIDLTGMLIPIGKAREFNYSVLDLGALVCRARTPKCYDCPIAIICKSRARFEAN